MNSTSFQRLILIPMIVVVCCTATSEAAEQPPSSKSLWNSVLNFFELDKQGRPVYPPGRGRVGGSRGDGSICIVNPGVREIVWDSQPLFLLRGNVAEVAVQPLGAEEEDPWQAVPTATDSGVLQASYDGNPLQPGGNYDWEFYESLPDHSTTLALRIPFQVMEEGEERDRIATELEQLQTDLKTQGADAEAIAQAHADYFFANDLWADALQQLFSVETPSPALVEERTALVEEICLQELQR